MPTFLLTVGDVSDIAGTCVIPTPGLAPTVRGLRDGLPIELRRPDGTIFQTQIYSVVLVGPDDPKRLTHITLRGISQRDIPVGTEIWLRDVVRTLSLGDDSTILRGFQCVLEKAGYASWVTTDELE